MNHYERPQNKALNIKCGFCQTKYTVSAGKIKQLILTACFFSVLSLLSGLSTAKRKFADSLNEFKFQCIGDAETDDEICIGELADRKSDTFTVPAEGSL